MRASFRPTGSRLLRGSSTKIKAINLVYPKGTAWAAQWGANYSASTNYSQLAAAAALGFNTVKVSTSNGSYDTSGGFYSWPSDAVFQARIAEFSQQCRQLGLRIYVAICAAINTFGTTGNDGPTNITQVLKPPLWWSTIAPDLVIGFDVANEWNNGQPTTWQNGGVTKALSDMDGVMRLIRVFTNIPLTVSVLLQSRADFTNQGSWFDAQAQISDFHDYHPYYQDNGRYSDTGDFPLYADAASLEARSKYLGRHMIGELGVAASASAFTTAGMLNGVGDMVRRPQSMGGVAFTLTDFDGNGYGICSDTLGQVPRAAKVSAIQAWPSAA